jgi:polyphosphate glucokinase
VSEYLQHVEALVCPDLIIVGGGISKESDKWIPMLTGVRARIVPAVLHNDAGIVGAAMAAAGIGVATEDASVPAMGARVPSTEAAAAVN